MNTPKYKIGDVLWDWNIDDDFGPQLISYRVDAIRKLSDDSFIYYTDELRGGHHHNVLLTGDERAFTSDVDALLDMLHQAEETGVCGCTMDEIYRLCLKTILNKLNHKKK